MKHINHKTVFVSLLAFFFLVSFTPPLKKTKKVEEKPIATFLPMGGGIIKPVTSQPISLVSGNENVNVNTTVSSSPVIQDILNNGDIDSVARLITENAIGLNEIIQPITPLPVKPLPLNSKSGLFKLAEKLKSKTNEETTNLQREYYKYDSTLKVFEKIITPAGSIEAIGFDPVRFTLTSNKDSIAIGEEFEIKITAEYLDINPSLMFQFEGSNEFTLKMLLPDGFIQTGGTYYDYIQGKVNKENPKQEFIVKGVFESKVEFKEFKLLRGAANSNTSSPYYLAAKISLSDPKQIKSIVNTRTKINNETLSKIVQGLTFSYLYDYCPPVYISFSRDPICGGEFSVSVSNCASSVTWVKDYNWNNPLWQTGTTIYTSDQGTYQAQCYNYCGELQYGTRTTNSGTFANNITINDVSIGCYQSEATLTVDGCNGSVSWNTGDTGTSITKGAGYYTAYCSTSCSTTSASASIHSPPPYPNTPSLSASKTFLCHNESATLYVGGCNSGSWLQWINQPSNTEAVGDGTYKIRCVNNCYASDYSEVTINRDYSTPSAPYISGPTSVCPGGMVYMNIDAGCSAGSNFSWRDGDNAVSHYDAAVSGGSYSINAWCTNTCSNRTSYSNTITVYANYAGSTPSIGTDKTYLCGSEQATLSASGCDGTVKWYVNGYWNNIGTGGSKAVGAGTYYAKCENSCGEGSQSNAITIHWLGNAANNISVTPGYTEVCDNASNTTLTVNNCNGTVSWSDGQHYGSTTRTEGPGFYTAYCDAGCSTTNATAYIYNKGYSPSTPYVTRDKEYVCGSEQATITASNCNGTVFWNDNQQWTGNSITVGAGSYFAKCINNCGISGQSDTKTINAGQPIAITGSSVTYQNNNSCGATYADLYVISVNDPNGNYTYSWDSGLGNGRGKRVYASGTYTVTISAYGLCTVTRQLVVNLIPKPATPILTANQNPACPGATITVSSNCGGTTNFSTNSTFVMGGSPVGIYASCTVNDCTSDNSLVLTINPVYAPSIKPTITASNTIICSANGNVPLSVSCGAGTTPVWSTNETTGTIYVSNAGSYTVVCRNGCGQNSPTSDPKAVTKDPTSTPNISANKTSVCGAELATITATNCPVGGTVKWSNNATGSSISVGVGTYTAICNTTCGDSSPSTPVTITTPAAPSIPTLTANIQNICAVNGTSTLTATCTSGEPIWWDDTKVGSKTVSDAGTYSVQCINSCGVRGTSQSKIITKDPTATPTIATNTTKICGTETATLTASGCPGTVFWSTGTSATTITVSTGGNYTAICRTSCGDSSPSNQIIINQNVAPDAPVLSSAASRTTICLGGANVVLSATGGCSAGNVVWFGSNGAESITRLNTNGTLTIDNNSFVGNNMTFRAICQTNCGTSGNSNEITINKTNFTTTAGSSSPNGEADEYVNNLSLYGNTAETNVSYAWTGPNGFNSTQKDPVILAANLSANHSGTYTVTVTNTNGCYTTATTSVLVDAVALACESYYVKSYYSTPAIEETSKLRRIGVTNTFEPISMALEVLDGATTFGLNYQWIAPAGVSLSPNNNALVASTNRIGNYKLTLSRGSSSCELPISLSGTPCTNKEGTFACTAALQPPTTTPNQLNNLVAGDEIYAADYKLVITEVTSGSQSAGWDGKALASFNLMQGFSIEAFPLEFKKISINECYEYIGATGVANPTIPDDFVGIRTQYDPNWDNVYSISFAFKGIEEIRQDLIDLFENFQNTTAYKQKIADKLAELQALIDQASARQLDADVKAELQAAIDALKNPCIPCLDASATIINNPNGRMASPTGICDVTSVLSSLKGLTPQQLLLKCLGGAATDILFSYVGKCFELWIDDNNTNDKNIADFTGITSQMNWSQTITSAGFSCLQSMNPFSSSKSKLIIAAGIAGNSTAAFFTDIMGQYDTYKARHGVSASISGFFDNIQWAPPITAAITQALAGIAIEALKAPSVKNVAEKLKQKIKTASGYLALQRKVGSYGCSPNTWQTICKSLGIPTLCFPAGTLITTDEGLKPIEKIKVDDKVISYNAEKKTFEPKKVTQLFRSTATKLVMIYALSGKLIVSATPEHPFFVKDAYKEAKQLVHGDTLLSYTKEVIIVDKIQTIDYSNEVYNFEVDDNHNYLVGNEGYLVHNACWNLRDFVDNFTLQQKKDYISDAWSKYYPEIFDARKFLEDLMGEYRFKRAQGWIQTYNSFPTIDFYKASSKLAVSMKTTKLTDVNAFLRDARVLDNITKLRQAKTDGFIRSGTTRYDITYVQMHVFFTKENYNLTRVVEWQRELKTNVLTKDITFIFDSIENNID